MCECCRVCEGRRARIQHVTRLDRCLHLATRFGPAFERRAVPYPTRHTQTPNPDPETPNPNPIQVPPAASNSPHFCNFSMYVAPSSILAHAEAGRSSPSAWLPYVGDASDRGSLKSVYLNIYKSGKCVAMAVPTQACGEELADYVSQILYAACSSQEPIMDVGVARDGEGGGAAQPMPPVLQDLVLPRRVRQRRT